MKNKQLCIGHVYKNIIPKFKTFKETVDYQKKYRKNNPLPVMERNHYLDYWNNNDLKEMFIRLEIEGYFPESTFISKKFSMDAKCNKIGAPVLFSYYIYPEYKEFSELNCYEKKVMKERFGVE